MFLFSSFSHIIISRLVWGVPPWAYRFDPGSWLVLISFIVWYCSQRRLATCWACCRGILSPGTAPATLIKTLVSPSQSLNIRSPLVTGGIFSVQGIVPRNCAPPAYAPAATTSIIKADHHNHLFMI